MAQRLVLFPDTNVFLQCRALHEVPWKDALEAEELELLIGAPVQDEIDRLKNDGNHRRARRAREGNSLFRTVLASAGESLTIREHAPKVTLRFAPLLPPKRETAETLDLTRSDDQLLDEVMHFRRAEPSAQILSGDTGMMFRARRLGVPLIPVPESWLLPPEKDERDRKISTLETQVAALRSTEAVLSLSLTSEDGQSLEGIDGSFPLYPDLTDTETARLIEAIQQRHPEVKTFGSAPTNQPAFGELEGLHQLIEKMSAWRAPTTDQISQYQKEYKEWIEKARKRFEQFGSFLNIRRRLRKLRISLANASSRPADEVLVEIKVHGNVTLLASVGDDVPDLIAQAEKLPLEVALPQPPTPPRGEYLYEALARNAQFGLGHVDLAAQLRSYMPDYSGIRSSFAKRDRHEFYRREEDDKPVTEASFTCEEFRHQRAPEVFSLWIVVPIQSESSKARLHIRASARNMTTPIDLYVPIDIQSESRSTYEIAAKWRIEDAS
jgi:PIN domain